MRSNNTVSILDRFSANSATGTDEADNDLYDESQYRAFGFIRKPWGNEPMFDLIFKSGVRSAIPYADLRRITLDPAIGIQLFIQDIITGRPLKITLIGRNLAQGYERLRMHRVTFACEADAPTEKGLAEDDMVITEIKEQLIEPPSVSDWEG